MNGIGFIVGECVWEGRIMKVFCHVTCNIHYLGCIIS